MSTKRSGVSALTVVLAVFAVGAIAWYGITQRGWLRTDQAAEIKGALVQRGPLRISVIERGNLRAADAVSLKSELEGNATILYLIPEGTVVQPGELLCELDASGLVDRRLAQEISVRNADAAYIKAQKNYEIQTSQNDSDIKKAEQKLLFAQKDLEKFGAEQGERTNQLAKSDEQITLAEERYKQAETKLSWSSRLFDKGFLTKSEFDADDLALKGAGIQLEAAKREKRLLEQYQLERTLIELQSGVDEGQRELERVKLQATARIVDYESDMRTREAQLRLETEKLQKLESQIAKAKLIAPRGGMVVYAQQESNRMGQSQPIQEGTQVRERQEIVTIPNAGGMVAQVSLHESVLKQVVVGQTCIVKVDALTSREFHGRVSFVAVLPDQNSWFANPNARLYRTDVHILDGDSEMRPGMSCAIEVLVEDIADATYVPVQAVYRSGGDNVVFVAQGGASQERKVKVGRYNNNWVEVTEGVKEGETVLLAPPADFVAQAAPQSDAPPPDAGPAGAVPPTGPSGAGAGKAPMQEPAAQPPAAAGAGADPRASFQNMSEEERTKARDQMRERFNNMTEEERAKAMEEMRSRGGGQRGGDASQRGGGRSRGGDGGGGDGLRPGGGAKSDG